MANNKLTIFNLLMFNKTNLSEEEKDIFDFDENVIQRFIDNLDKGWFYLGGQLKMRHNDIINLDSIEQVREINRKRAIEYGGPCNSFEAGSIYRHEKDLVFIENMIKKYNQIMMIREQNYTLESGEKFVTYENDSFI